MLEFLFIPAAQAGVITDAKPISHVLLDALYFLLSVAGIVGIIGLVVCGVIYLAAAGDEKRATLAKRAAFACIVGVVIILGALVMVSQIGNFLS